MISSAQCRAARGLVGWSQQELAKNAGVGTVAIHQLESGTSQPRRATLDVVRRAGGRRVHRRKWRRRWCTIAKADRDLKEKVGFRIPTKFAGYLSELNCRFARLGDHGLVSQVTY